MSEHLMLERDPVWKGMKDVECAGWGACEMGEYRLFKHPLGMNVGRDEEISQHTWKIILGRS